MDQNGVMYLLVEDPEAVDVLGNLVDKEHGLIEEGLSRIEQQGLRLINCVWTRRVVIDDATKALYKMEDADTEFFYLRDFPPLHSLTEEKVLYVYVNTLVEAKRSVNFLDKFEIEWSMKLEAEIKDLTFLGTPVTMLKQAHQILRIGHQWGFQCQHRVHLPIKEFNLRQRVLESHS